MKHAFQLTSASVVALFAASAQAVIPVETFSIDFEDYTNQAKPSGAVSGGTWSNGGDSYVETDSNNNNNKQLVIDAERTDALTFAPSNTTTAVSMDVRFVGASTAPDPVTGSMAGIYLDNTTHELFASVNEGAFGTTDIAVSEGEWYTVALSFNANGTVTITVSQNGSQVGTWTSSATVSSGIVSYVDFYGSGKVDNFVGTGPLVPQTNDGTTDENANSTDMTIANGVLTTQFASTLAGTGALKFITVTGTDRNGDPITRTLRVVNANQQNIAIAAAGITSVSKVVAYYGDDVTATTGYTPATTTPTMDTNTESPTYGSVTGSVTVKSGLYYSIETNGTKTLLRNTPIAPEEEGTTLNYTVTPSNTGYDVVKFKIVASDSAQ